MLAAVKFWRLQFVYVTAFSLIVGRKAIKQFAQLLTIKRHFIFDAPSHKVLLR